MRTKNPDPPTRNKLLEAAQAIMMAKGYVATTVDEICAEAGVTKGSFFHYFKNKEDLGKAVLERFATSQAARMGETCGHLEDPLERIYCLLDFVRDAGQCTDTKGCLVGTFAQEISETHPELRNVCHKAFEGFAASAARDLVAAKDKYAPDSDFDAESLGTYLLSIIQGSMLILKSSGEREHISQNVAHLRIYLKSLYGR